MNFKKSLEEDLNFLISKICSDWGFYLKVKSEYLLKENKIITAEIFSREIIISQGLDPDFEIDYYRRIKTEFSERYGSEVSIFSYRRDFLRLN